MNDAFVTIKLEAIENTCVRLFPDTGVFTLIEQEYLIFLSNGSADMKWVDGRNELIALYAYNQQLNLFFRHQSYVLNPYHSSAILHRRFYRKSIFILKQFDQEVLRIVYRPSLVRLDVLESITNLLRPKDKDSVANKMQWKVSRFMETDLVKRLTLDMEYSAIEREKETPIWKVTLLIWPKISFIPILILTIILWLPFIILFFFFADRFLSLVAMLIE